MPCTTLFSVKSFPSESFRHFCKLIFKLHISLFSIEFRLNMSIASTSLHYFDWLFFSAVDFCRFTMCKSIKKQPERKLNDVIRNRRYVIVLYVLFEWKEDLRVCASAYLVSHHLVGRSVDAGEFWFTELLCTHLIPCQL